MKNNQFISWAFLIACSLLCGSNNANADAIVMSNNRVLTGTAIQTNDTDILILTRYAAFNFSKTSIKGIIPESAQTAAAPKVTRLPDFQDAILLLSKQPWATNLSPIPATVVDKGILRSVPYTSFRCGQDYEVNLYGDLENPAGIEIGIYQKLLQDDSAKSNCVNFISSLLRQSADKDALQSLNRAKDLKSVDDYTFEITPPTDKDSYNGWWVSVYSVNQLNLSRASDKEMQLISMTHAEAENDAENSTNSTSWTSNDLKQARPPTTISLRNSAGIYIKNAEVVRVIDGVSLIWKNGPTSGGMVKLADLPKDLREQFGYDEAKTKAAEIIAKNEKVKWAAQLNAAAVAQSSAVQNDFSSGPNFPSSSISASGGGRVYVHGYYRANGTYVNSYTRSAPHRR